MQHWFHSTYWINIIYVKHTSTITFTACRNGAHMNIIAPVQQENGSTISTLAVKIRKIKVQVGRTTWYIYSSFFFKYCSSCFCCLRIQMVFKGLFCLQLFNPVGPHNHTHTHREQSRAEQTDEKNTSSSSTADTQAGHYYYNHISLSPLKCVCVCA